MDGYRPEDWRMSSHNAEPKYPPEQQSNGSQLQLPGEFKYLEPYTKKDCECRLQRLNICLDFDFRVVDIFTGLADRFLYPREDLRI